MSYQEGVEDILTRLVNHAQGTCAAYCSILNYAQTHSLDELASYVEAQLPKDCLTDSHDSSFAFRAACHTVLELLEGVRRAQTRPLLPSRPVADPPSQQAVLAEWGRHGADGYTIGPGYVQFDDCALCHGFGWPACTGHDYDPDALDCLEDVQDHRKDTTL